MRVEEEKQRLERAERRARRAERRADHLMGSDTDTDYSEDGPTWQDLQMGMIQAEADSYMNSPKAGSE